MATLPLILASTSSARQKLLAQLRLPFTSFAPDIDESRLPGEAAETLVMRLGELKARAIAKTHPPAIIIGADQVGTLGPEFLTKPLTHDNARAQLRKMSGRMITFWTGMCVLNSLTQACHTHLSRVDVYFKTLSEQQIEGYLRLDRPYQCAGSIRIEGLGVALLEKMIAEDYTAAIGLPLMKLSSLLHEEGIVWMRHFP